MNAAPTAVWTENRWRMLAIICTGVVGVLATWFSAIAIMPELILEWGLSPMQAGWMTNAVQIGFVVGAVGASFVNLPDVVAMHRLITVSALLATLANAALLVVGAEGAIVARFLTGICLAGVYPPALKLMATWFVKGRGLALGFLIGALTLGSSMPHLVRAVTDGVDWRTVVWVTSATALGGIYVIRTWRQRGPPSIRESDF